MPKRRSSAERVSFVLNSFMILAYGLAGVALYFWRMPSISDSNRKVLSGVLILYSLFRLYKLLRIKSKNNES